MDTIDPQAQDSLISNGVAETATVSPPASPPQSLTSALSDLSRTAEQGKDGGEQTSFACRFSVHLRILHQVLLLHTQRLLVLVLLPKSSARSTSIRNSWKRTAPHPEQVRYPPLPRLQRSRVQQVSLYVQPIKSLPTNGSAKSPPPLATSHSRLVTTKLTKLPSSSTGGGTGWTRPSSTTPSLAPSPVSGSVSSAPPVAPAPVSHGPPQLPHVGNVIQPQPRGAIQAPLAPKPEASNGSSKPVWRNVKQGGNSSGAGPPLGVQSEFPTAAEVAQGAFV
jgi:hypothetical protein